MDTMAPAPELPSLGGSLAVTFLSLGLVCLLAYVALKWLSGRGVGQGMGPIRILARCPLEPKRTLFLVEIAGRAFLIGAGDGPMTTLAEVDPKELERLELHPYRNARARGPSAAGLRFAEVLARLRARVASARGGAGESTQPVPGPMPSAAHAAADIGDVVEDMNKPVTAPAGERS
jgi:flagellar biosynthetic protein FliO